MRARTVAGLLAAAVLLQVATANTLYANYQCPITCDAEPNCMAASDLPPGGLANGNTPQFIVLTNDDAVTLVTQPVILNVTERHTNKNGCKMPATWFVSTAFSDPLRIKENHELGHEIATHTVDHVSNPNITEIVGARTWLNQTAGIPLEDLQGFRAPFLLYNPQQRQILSQNGFRYDSSISEQYSNRHPLSPNAQNRMWPYTFDCGVASDCNIGTGSCDDSERWNGLWEFPLYASQDDQGTVIGTMDPQGDMYEIFKREFDNRYSGNRAPVGIYIHAAWLIANPEAADQINRFLDYAMTHDDVFLVTISQVLDWMKNPVPASKYDPGCKATKTASNSCMPPSTGCGAYGTFNAETCVCDCQNERVNIAGYCKDNMASCTVQKQYNYDTKLFYCPTTTPTPDTGSTSSGTTSSGQASTPTNTPNPAAMVVSGDAKCGHPLVRYLGLSASGSADPSVLYANNLKAIDGDCSTCSFIEAANGQAFFELRMENTRSLKGVQLLTNVPNTTVNIRVGNDQSNNGRLNPTCATNVAIPANSPTAVPCMATGSELVIVSNANLTLCDVYPMDADTTPATTTPTTTGGSNTNAGNATATTPVGKPVTLQFDVSGMTVDEYNQNYAAAVCKSIVQMTGDSSASCVVNTVAAKASGRRLMQAQSSTVHVVMTVYVSNPDLIAKAFSNGAMLSNLLKPTGVTVVPTSVLAASASTTPSANTTAPAPANAATPTSSGTSSSSSNIGAIVGGVVGGICGLALLCGAGYWYYRRRQAKADASGRVPSVSNPVYDATATVTTQKSLKGNSASSSPLKDAAGSFH